MKPTPEFFPPRGLLRLGCAAAVLLAASGCMHRMHGGALAVGELKPTAGHSASGSVRFHQHRDHVMVMAQVQGLKPNQEHGFHVHEKGDCSAPDATSAGGHFNPAGTPHGPQHGPHHAGDMPSLKADANGKAEARFRLEGVSVGTGAANDVVGRGLIVHIQPDDYSTQPTGNAGARIACAVIALSSR